MTKSFSDGEILTLDNERISDELLSEKFPFALERSKKV